MRYYFPLTPNTSDEQLESIPVFSYSSSFLCNKNVDSLWESFALWKSTLGHLAEEASAQKRNRREHLNFSSAPTGSQNS